MSDVNTKECEGIKSQEMKPGFCSAVCTDMESLRKEIGQEPPKTSDVNSGCGLPKRFEHPHWFNGYGCQVGKQHPFYRTSSSEYGWYPPGLHSVPSSYFPKTQQFSNELATAGIYSVTPVFFPAGQKFTNKLTAAGMYRNYSLNTGMDPAGYS